MQQLTNLLTPSQSVSPPSTPSPATDWSSLVKVVTLCVGFLGGVGDLIVLGDVKDLVPIVVGTGLAIGALRIGDLAASVVNTRTVSKTLTTALPVAITTNQQNGNGKGPPAPTPPPVVPPTPQ